MELGQIMNMSDVVFAIAVASIVGVVVNFAIVIGCSLHRKYTER